MASGQTASAVTDTNLVIIPTRQEDSIQSDLDKARKLKAESDRGTPPRIGRDRPTSESWS